MTTYGQIANSKQKRWVTGGLIFLMTLFVLYGLEQLFPYTGLAGIVVLPFISLLNGLIIIATIKSTKNVKKRGYAAIWITIALLTILTAMTLHPQEFRPSVFKQISYSFSAIRQFHNSPISDLDLPFSVENFNRYDCKIKDAREKYIVALYKYRNTIPLDGSFHVYREENTEIVSYGFDTSIKNIESIPNKFATGQDKVIWWILSLI